MDKTLETEGGERKREKHSPMPHMQLISSRLMHKDTFWRFSGLNENKQPPTPDGLALPACKQPLPQLSKELVDMLEAA